MQEVAQQFDLDSGELAAMIERMPRDRQIEYAQTEWNGSYLEGWYIWQHAMPGHFTGDPAQVMPMVDALERFRRADRASKSDAELNRLDIEAIAGVYMLAWAWREAGVHGVDIRHAIALLEAAGQSKDELVMAYTALCCRVMIDDMGFHTPSSIIALHERLMQNDLVRQIEGSSMQRMDDMILGMDG